MLIERSRYAPQVVTIYEIRAVLEHFAMQKCGILSLPEILEFAFSSKSNVYAVSSHNYYSFQVVFTLVCATCWILLVFR